MIFVFLPQEYPTLTTFFEGEIISRKHPFLTRKWDADEDVDRKHWVSASAPPQARVPTQPSSFALLLAFRASFWLFISMQNRLTQTTLITKS